MKKILIVEDEIAYVKLLRSHLVKKGYTVLQAIDGKEGFAIAKRERPDLILLDLRMPVMDGMSMLTALRQDKTIAKTKVILLTNLEPDDKIIGDTIRNQPSYYCVKSDVSFHEVLNKIEEILDD